MKKSQIFLATLIIASTITMTGCTKKSENTEETKIDATEELNSIPNNINKQQIEDSKTETPETIPTSGTSTNLEDIDAELDSLSILEEDFSDL